MKDKTPLEKIADGIKLREELKKNAITNVKLSRLEEWNEAVEESPYNEYFGIDMACAIAIMKARKKGLPAKDALRISEHHYKVPAERTGDLLYKYYDDEDKFYNDFVGEERKSFCKRLINSRKD